MGILVIWIGTFNINMYLLLVIQILVGVIFYVGVSYAFRIESFEYLLNLLKNFFNKNKEEKKVC